MAYRGILAGAVRAGGETTRGKPTALAPLGTALSCTTDAGNNNMMDENFRCDMSLAHGREGERGGERGREGTRHW